MNDRELLEDICLFFQRDIDHKEKSSIIARRRFYFNDEGELVKVRDYATDRENKWDDWVYGPKPGEANG